MKQKIAILGAGSWGTALAMVLKDNGHDVCLWGNNASQIEEINTNHTNHQYLPEVILNEEIHATIDLAKALSGANAVLFVLPTKVIRLVAKQVAPLLEGNPVIIHASKGLEQESYLRISEILKQELIFHLLLFHIHMKILCSTFAESMTSVTNMLLNICRTSLVVQGIRILLPM